MIKAKKFEFNGGTFKDVSIRLASVYWNYAGERNAEATFMVHGKGVEPSHETALTKWGIHFAPEDGRDLRQQAYDEFKVFASEHIKQLSGLEDA